jgi:hypothetical protein
MTPDEYRILTVLSLARDIPVKVVGKDKEIAEQMEAKGWVVWHGTDYGASAYKITQMGEAVLTGG